MNVAYLCEPHTGGMWTFFLRAQPALALRGITMRAVCPFDWAPYAAADFPGREHAEGLALTADPAESTRRLLAHLRARAYDLAVVLPGGYLLTSNLPPYLPRSIACVARVPMNTRGAYRPVQAVAPHYSRVVAVIERIAEDLIQGYGVEAARVETIHNGIAITSPLPGVERAGPFTLLYVGRLEELQKNILILPDILARVVESAPEARMIVAGDGPDRAALARLFAGRGLGGRVTWAAPAGPADVAALFQRAHALLLTSRYEGFPNTVLEAMVAGCVPVLADLRQISRVVVAADESGFVVPMDQPAAYAQAALRLADEDVRRRMAGAAQRRVAEHFTVERMADRYAALFRRLKEEPDPRPPAVPWAQFRIHPALQPTWRTRIPKPVKRLVRPWLEKLGLSA